MRGKKPKVVLAEVQLRTVEHISKLNPICSPCFLINIGDMCLYCALSNVEQAGGLSNCTTRHEALQNLRLSCSKLVCFENIHKARHNSPRDEYSQGVFKTIKQRFSSEVHCYALSLFFRKFMCIVTAVCPGSRNSQFYQFLRLISEP